jgi:hypothetical protein
MAASPVRGMYDNHLHCCETLEVPKMIDRYSLMEICVNTGSGCDSLFFHRLAALVKRVAVVLVHVSHWVSQEFRIRG